MAVKTKDVNAAMKKKKVKKAIPSSAFLNTGSTLLNLACSGRVGGGFFKGGYVFLVGDSASGKTWFSLTCMAEASINPNFDGYRFIFDNAENGALMDVRRCFGNKMADRLEPPAGTPDEPEYSTTVEEFFYHLDKALSDDRPCIYVLDSMDVLQAEEANENFEARRNRHFTGKGKVKGSMGMEKPKTISQNFGRAISKLDKSKSVLVIITQTRDKFGFGVMPGEKTRAGGNAPTFYAHHEIWTKKVGKRRKKVNGKFRTVGDSIRLTLKNKNRVNGWLGDIEVPIYRTAGIDDLGGCIEFLVKENWWKVPKGKKDADDDRGPPLKVIAPEFDYDGTVEGLVKQIEEAGEEDKLRDLVSDCWRGVEEQLAVHRKSRYRDNG